MYLAGVQFAGTGAPPQANPNARAIGLYILQISIKYDYFMAAWAQTPLGFMVLTSSADRLSSDIWCPESHF